MEAQRCLKVKQLLVFVSISAPCALIPKAFKTSGKFSAQ